VLRHLGPSAVPALVFVTAFDRYALEAFEQHALDYLLKPFSDERFGIVLERIRTRLREHSLARAGAQLVDLLAATGRRSPQTIVVRDGSRTVVIRHEDIVWLEAEDYYVRIHARDRRVLVREPLRTLAERLDPTIFVRVHRSAIANVHCIHSIEPLASGDQRVVLSDGTELRASRTRRAELLRRLHDARA
jgi:two-component system, LytTR family, response regulator